MAFENLNGGACPSFEATTGLSQYQAVVINSAGKLAAPTDGAAIDGVLRSITSSTASGYTPVGTIYVGGMVAKMLAAGSTVAVGDLVSVSTAGYATATAAGDYTVGRVVGGSSGSTGRVLSVLLSPIGTT